MFKSLGAVGMTTFAFMVAMQVSSVSVASAQSFSNPSFEQPVYPAGDTDCTNTPCAMDWTSSIGLGYALQVRNTGGGDGPTPFGNQFIVLDSNTVNTGESYIEQQVSGFEVGKTRELRFSVSSEFAAAASKLAVTLTNATPAAPIIFSAAGVGPSKWDTWVSRTLTFTPQSTAVTFRFTHVTVLPNGSGVGLDNISLGVADHEVCYLIKNRFTPPPVFYSDQFGMRQPVVFAKNKRYLCTPATKCVPAANCIDAKGNSTSCGNATIDGDCCEECETNADCGTGTCQNCACVP